MYMAPQAMLNQSLFDDHHQDFSFPSNTSLMNMNTIPDYAYMTQPSSSFSSLLVDDDDVHVLPLPPPPPPTLSQSPNLKYEEQDHIFSHFGRPQILSLQTSAGNLWALGELTGSLSLGKRNGMNNINGISAIKMKKSMKGRKNVREPRFCFKTLSDVDVLDDGYKWRKYGQKVVKNTQHPRSYYRCTQDNCRVKKRIERLTEDPRMVITSYEGRHVHYPSNDEDDTQTSPNITNFF